MIKLSVNEIDEAKQILLNSGILCFPTDTVFGLGCLYDDLKAIDKIYEAKNRSIDKKLPVMVSDTEMLKDYVELDEVSEKLFKAYEGPLTIILKKKGSEETLAIRIPNDDYIKELIRKVNKPLSVTSANISGKASLTKCEDVIREIGERVDGIVMGDASGERASTIVDSLHDFKILREGPVSLKQIEEITLK